MRTGRQHDMRACAWQLIRGCAHAPVGLRVPHARAHFGPAHARTLVPRDLASASAGASEDSGTVGYVSDMMLGWMQGASGGSGQLIGCLERWMRRRPLLSVLPSSNVANGRNDAPSADKPAWGFMGLKK